ncbi:hypothetical protein CCR75_007942 [Bremia lactucae]|uniref:Uncharacterized protein n=1 Tax=Bremia lactucae TaxID=4779 RepID=A0A976NZ03_BRELC|nr:hypothetical protein CCR75_007942 [Bremia lactucae]
MDREAARTRMLNLWLMLSTTSAANISVHTNQGTVMHVDNLISNAGQTLLACINLATPVGTYTHAVLRDHEVAQIEWNLSKTELKTLVYDDLIEMP